MFLFFWTFTKNLEELKLILLGVSRGSIAVRARLPALLRTRVPVFSNIWLVKFRTKTRLRKALMPVLGIGIFDLLHNNLL